MRVRSVVLLLCSALGACATLPATGDTPYLPPGVFGVYEDNDVGAINLAAWALASPARTRGDPVDAAKAVIAVEYLAGELRASPRWIGMSAGAKQGMLHARTDLRQVLGIRPDAPPQAVVDALLGVIGALNAGNQPAALQVLSGPSFTRPPPGTLATLANLPFIPAANFATSAAADQELPGDGPRQ
jgi:hypothetical protein